MKLNRIIIYSGSTLTCAEFFRDVFGLKPIGEWTEEWAELDGAGCRLAFHQAYIDGERHAKPTGSPMNPHKIVFTVDDVDETRRQLVEKGVEMDEVKRFPELDGLVFCDGADPEGHRFQICNR